MQVASVLFGELLGGWQALSVTFAGVDPLTEHLKREHQLLITLVTGVIMSLLAEEKLIRLTVELHNLVKDSHDVQQQLPTVLRQNRETLDEILTKHEKQINGAMDDFRKSIAVCAESQHQTAELVKRIEKNQEEA